MSVQPLWDISLNVFVKQKQIIYSGSVHFSFYNETVVFLCTLYKVTDFFMGH